MRDLVLLCTKNVHFSYNGDIYTQADGVAIGSPLSPESSTFMYIYIYIYIYMVELEQYCQL